MRQLINNANWLHAYCIANPAVTIRLDFRQLKAVDNYVL